MGFLDPNSPPHQPDRAYRAAHRSCSWVGWGRAFGSVPGRARLRLSPPSPTQTNSCYGSYPLLAEGPDNAPLGSTTPEASTNAQIIVLEARKAKLLVEEATLRGSAPQYGRVGDELPPMEFILDLWFQVPGVHDEPIHRDEPDTRNIRKSGWADIVRVEALAHPHQVSHFLGLGGQCAGRRAHERRKVLPTHEGGLGLVEEEVVLADDIDGGPHPDGRLPSGCCRS